MRKIIGWCLIASPFLLIAYWMMDDVGFLGVFVLSVAFALASGNIFIGVRLITGDNNGKA